jgi:hypothetical protein
MSTVLASGADARYGNWLLNLVGSVKANSDVFDRIVLYDLGLTPFQRRLADNIRGVEVRTVPPLVPHWREGRTWKTWIWTHSGADVLFWLDAGVTVLRPLDRALAQIDERGYFVVSQGHPVRDSIPSDYYELFAFPRDRSDNISIAAGILGFDTHGAFYRRVIEPTAEAARQGFSVGFSAGEVDRLNYGLDRTDAPVLRDCERFRHEQTLLNINFYRAVEHPVLADLDEYGGWRSNRDHPRQVIWNHRRRGDSGYLPRVPYTPAVTPLGKSWGVWLRWRWWAANHSWLFKPASYIRKVRNAATIS